MGFWDDLGAVTEEFGSKFTTARRFRIQRESDAQRQALQRQEMAIREAELNSRLSRLKEEKEIRAQIRVLANEYNRILATPTPGIWDFQNHTITDKAAQELIKISAQIAALDPQVGSTYGRYVDMIYQQPKPKEVEPSPKEKEIRDYERRFSVKVTPDEYKTWGKADAGDPEDKVIRDLTVDFLKDEKTMMLAKAQAEAESKVFDPVEYATTKATQALSIIERSKAQREAHKQRLETQKVGSSNVGELRKTESIPTEAPIINEPQDTVEVDINDPRLRDTTFTESPFGIDVKAPATAEDEPASEDEVRQYVEEYKAGKKPLPTYRTARTYFKKALEKGFTTKKFYDTFHSRFLSPMYPDTTK